MLVFIQTHALEIVSFLLVLSEALAYIPGVKANSIFQAIVNGLKKVKDLISKPKDPA